MKRLLAATTLALALCLPVPGFGTDYVKFSGIDGSVVSPADRAGESELKEYRGGLERKDGKVVVKETKIKKCADAASVDLAIKLVTGEVIPEVTLDFFAPGEDGTDVLSKRIRLCNVTIIAIDTEKLEGKKLEETICVEFEQYKLIDPVSDKETVIDLTEDGT